jgi:hypothetical protein
MVVDLTERPIVIAVLDEAAQRQRTDERWSGSFGVGHACWMDLSGARAKSKPA